MKIFGKRKSKAVTSDSPSKPGDTDDGDKSVDTTPTKAEASEDENVPSYFSSAQLSTSASSKKKKQRNESSTPQVKGDDMQALLDMDPSKLNAKQRRLVKRHEQREGKPSAAAESVDPSKDEEKNESTEDSNEKKKGDATEQDETLNNDAQKSPAADSNITEILAKLEGLNSKERRKFLRQLKTSSGGAIDESVIEAAQEQALKVAERNEKNEKEAANATSETKRKSMDEKAQATKTPEPTKPKKKRRKKGPEVNLADLTPDERKRREEQRRMQVEAKARQEAGLVDPNRHPLNSERRRANRRKPSKAALIAQAKREAMAEKGKFNAVGYNMRKGGDH